MAFPSPFIVEASQEHKRTMIMLHGRGMTGRDLSGEMLGICGSAVSDDVEAGLNLQGYFPDMRFIFPTVGGQAVMCAARDCMRQIT